MQRALKLAAANAGRTGDNPSVGCVIVKGDAVVGEGVTGVGGRPHAEEVALAAVGETARGAVAYVTVEPCARRSAGTTACADLLIAAGVARVVIATGDPHPYAAGVGVERLRAAGVAVEAGVLEAEARALNADFFARWTRRPEVSVLPAQPRHRDFAVALYLRTMEPLTLPLMQWDEQKQRESVLSQWKVEGARVVVLDGALVGWLQTDEDAHQIYLRHFYIVPEHQRRGYGGEVLRRLIESVGKPIELAVLKGNPARRLYERFGFVVVGEEAVKLVMRREAVRR